MSEEVLVYTEKDSTSNPAPIGLLGFGMTTVLLNVHNIGAINLSSMILAMGIFYGGTAQVFAGFFEWKKGNTFGSTAFVSYGFFWLTLVALIVMPKLGWIDAPTGYSMPIYLVMWGLFTLGLFIATFKLNRTLQIIFGTLVLLFLLLALGEVMHSSSITHLAGWIGLVCGFSACYGALAQVINDVYGKVVCPL